MMPKLTKTGRRRIDIRKVEQYVNSTLNQSINSREKTESSINKMCAWLDSKESFSEKNKEFVHNVCEIF